MGERCIYKGIEEPSYLLAWTATEFTFCFALWGFFSVIAHHYLLGMIVSGGLALTLVTKRTEFSARCQLQHILHKFGLWRRNASLCQHYKDISPYRKDDDKPQTTFPESSQVEFLSRKSRLFHNHYLPHKKSSKSLNATSLWYWSLC